MSKKLPDRIYRELSISQRIRAAWLAQQRDDTVELEKLENPKEAGEYEISRVSAALLDIQLVGMAAQIDILNNLTSHLVAIIRLEKTEEKAKAEEIIRQIEETEPYPAAIASALKELAENIGLERNSILNGLIPLHPMAKAMIERHIDDAPETLIRECKEAFSDFLRERHPKIACFHPAKQAR